MRCKEYLVLSLLVFATCSFSFPDVIYGQSRITGSGGRDNRTQEQKRNWKNESPKNDPRWNQLGRKGLNKILGPFGPLTNKTEEFSKKYKEYRDRKGNVTTGTGIVRDKRWK